MDVASAVGALVSTGEHRAFGPLDRAERINLTTLYARTNNRPLWTNASGVPGPAAFAALGQLEAAADEGLNPADYHAAAIQELAARLAAPRTPNADDIATFDTALSVNTLKYFRQLHEGRVDARAIGFKMAAPVHDDDYAALLQSASANGRIGDTAAGVAPPLVLYRSLRGKLAEYRRLAADATLVPVSPQKAAVHPGEPYQDLARLHAWLVALNDLPTATPLPDEAVIYDGAIAEGVKHFQVRHGLAADGVLGASTQAALSVPLSWRVRQIELAMERLRWLPHLGDTPFLAINIPMFHLWGWDSIPSDGAPTFDMGVIVGRAVNNQTPVMVAQMRDVVFRPYWRVPASILRKEILPDIARDPAYLDRHNMEIVSGAGDDERPVAATEENLARLRALTLRLRERPGPSNSLGLVRFNFPNDESIYMHGTPAHSLFGRSRRDFSHGCVRLEDPTSLAVWALNDQPQWTRDRIVETMNGGETVRVPVTRAIRVVLFYVTAVVMPEDGSIRFADDIYGHDTRLERGLASLAASNEWLASR